MKKLVATVLVLCLVLNCLPLFVSASEQNESPIMHLLSVLDIMVGDEYGNFNLDDFVTRAEFTKIAIMASEHRNSVPENSNTAPFGDVPYKLWSAPYIALAVDNGLVSGYPDSTFRPENTVLLEEAVTICLNLLGYEKADYGRVWPSGPISLAKNLDLLDNVEKGAGETLKRRDVMHLIYNTINTKVKGTNNELINHSDYEYMEDTVLIATKNEDSSVSKNKVVTSKGTFKIAEDFDISEMVGKKGDAFIKNGDTLASFSPSEQTFSTHAVYAVLNSDIIVYDSFQTKSLDIDKDLICYSGVNEKTVNSAVTGFNTGDAVRVAYDEDGDAEYVLHWKEELEGPYIVRNEKFAESLGIPSDVAVIADGKIKDLTAVKEQDVVYYSKELNLLWAYNNKLTGTYTQAIPSKENPTSVVISGNSYDIESAQAYNKLSSGGDIKLGDTITVLLGRNGAVADVYTGDSSVSQYGYLKETGKKEFVNAKGNTEVSFYATIVTASGKELEVKTAKEYSDYKNHIVKAEIENGVASITKSLRYDNKVSGTFNAEKMTIAYMPVADNVEILDVINANDVSEMSGYISVYPQRLHGAELSTSNILYVTYNKQNEIDGIFLNDVTGDGYKYGIVTEATTNAVGMGSNASYTCDIDGGSMLYNKALISGLAQGNPVAVITNGNSISELKKLRKLTDKITKVSDGYAYTSDGEKYILGDNVAVYKKEGTSREHYKVSINDVDFKKGTFEYYYNNTLSVGGRIRVIVWTVS